MSIDPAEPCAGEWFLNWGTGVEGHWFVQIECNGGDVGDCGWVQPLDLEQTGCVTSEDVLEFEDAHERHRTLVKKTA